MIYPVKRWDVELNRDEIKRITDEIDRRYSEGRDKGTLNRVLSGLLGEKGYVPSDTADGWTIKGENGAANAVHEGEQSYGAPDNTGGDSALRVDHKAISHAHAEKKSSTRIILL